MSKEKFIAAVAAYQGFTKIVDTPKLINLAKDIKPFVDASFAAASTDRNDVSWLVYNTLKQEKDLVVRAIVFDTIILKTHPRTKNLNKAQRATLLSTFKTESNLMAQCSGGDFTGLGTSFRDAKVTVFGLYQMTGIRALLFLKWFVIQMAKNSKLQPHDIYNPFFQISYMMDEIEGFTTDIWLHKRLKGNTSWFLGTDAFTMASTFTEFFIAPRDNSENVARGKWAALISNKI